MRLDKVSLKQFTHQMGNSMPEKKNKTLPLLSVLIFFHILNTNRKHLLTSAILGLLTVHFMYQNFKNNAKVKCIFSSLEQGCYVATTQFHFFNIYMYFLPESDKLAQGKK